MVLITFTHGSPTEFPNNTDRNASSEIPLSPFRSTLSHSPLSDRFPSNVSQRSPAHVLGYAVLGRICVASFTGPSSSPAIAFAA